MNDRYGFIHDEMDIKVLILYILRKLSFPAPRNELTDVVLLSDNGVGYFEFSECLSDLVRRGQVEERDGLFSITEVGRENGEVTETSLPYSVRIRAERAAAALAATLSRSNMITTTHELRQRGGFNVNLRLNDDEGQIISIELLCGSETEVKKIEENFKQNAEEIYGRIIDALTM